MATHWRLIICLLQLTENVEDKGRNYFVPTARSKIPGGNKLKLGSIAKQLFGRASSCDRQSALAVQSRTNLTSRPQKKDHTGEAGRRLLLRYMAAALFTISGVVTIISAMLPAPANMNHLGVIAVGLAGIVMGIAVLIIPWHRLPDRGGIFMVAIAFILITLHNHFGGVDAYRYGLFYVVVFIWIGLVYPQGTSTLFLPLLAVSYLVPLVTSPQYSLPAASSVLYTVLVCVLVGETLAWMSKRLRQHEGRFHSLVQNSSDVITVIDADSTIRYQTPSVERVFGYSPSEIIGTKLTELLHPDDLAQGLAFIAEVKDRRHTTVAVEWRWRHRNGSWLQVETIGSNLVNDKNVRGLVLNSRDVSDHKELEAQLIHQAFHDPLTNLANRALFKDRVAHALARAHRSNEPIAVLFLDLDNFKTINDSLGHVVGDQLLVAVAQRLQACLREADTAARFGGDEFAILLEDTTHAGEAALVAERVIDVLRTPFIVKENEMFVSASIGIALSGVGNEEADELLRNADVAMYKAKGNKKGTYEIFKPSMHTVVVERLQLEADLQRALQNQEFIIHYQPVVRLQTGKIVGMEALVRWMHPDRGLLHPKDFISIAEETELIIPIGQWVLKQACRDLRLLQAKYPSDPPLTVAVNLSGKQLQQPTITTDIAEALKETGLQPQSLMLEITESAMMQDTETPIAGLYDFKRLGVLVAIDDFGTGYSSLSYLQRFPIDTIKIDKSFIDYVGNESQQSALTYAIITLAKTLRIQTVAEGIEHIEQVEHLRKLGCGLGQGFYFAKPLDKEGIDSLLRQASLGPGWLADRRLTT